MARRLERIPFVWDSAKTDDAAKTPPSSSEPPSTEPRDAVERRGGSRRRSLLIGSGVLVLAAGAVGAAAAFSTHPQHTVTTGAASMTVVPSSLIPGPSTRPYASRSATPKATRATASARKNTAAAKTLRSAAAASSNAGSGSVAEPAVVGAPAVPASPARPALPAPAGEWLLNQTTGNTAVDSTGAHDGTAEDGWFSGTCFLVNGTNSQMFTNGPVLSTGSGHSFTVSAWVDMTALPASGSYDETAVSQDGGQDSGFYLQYTEPADRWAFSRVADNGENPTAYRALSASEPSLSTWTHLVGVYNAANHTEYLYVNGVAQGTATDPTPFAASGDLAVGRAQYNGQDTDWLKGGVKRVEVFGTALDAAQVSELN